MASSLFLGLSSASVTSIDPVTASSSGASRISAGSPRANCPLIKERLTNDRLLASKPRYLLPVPEVFRRRCLVRSSHSTVETSKGIQFAAARQQSESLVADSAAAGSTGVEGSSLCPCRVCGRRGLVAALAGLIASTGNNRVATACNFESPDYNAIREAVHPARPEWYEEFYAQTMAKTMVSYEAEVADYKRHLFGELDEKVERILELGIGTGPNLKYYGNLPRLQQVVGVDPNLQMAKYCADSATAAGLSDSQFEFLNAVGEGIPVSDESMDAVVCTLTLCSVSDVKKTLQEIKRVLRPGGAFVFIEHVIAPEGTGLRLWQGLLDPLQQWVADGCHLTRDTLQHINGAHFGAVQSEQFNVSSVSLISPHVKGIAYK